MFDRVNAKGINVIYIISYGMLVIFLVHYIESLVWNIGYNIPVIGNADALVYLNIILTPLFNSASLIVALLLYRKVKPLLESEIDKSSIYFGIAVYLVVVSIGGFINVIPEIVIYFIDNLFRTLDFRDTYRFTFMIVRAILLFLKMFLAYYFVRKSGYLNNRKNDDIA